MKKSAYLVLFFLALFSAASFFFFYFPIRNVPISYLMAGSLLIWILYFLFYNTLSSLPFDRQVRFILSSAAVIAVLFLISTRGPQNYLEDNSILTIFLVYIGSFLVVAVSIAFLLLKLKDSGRTITNKANGWDFLLYFIIPFLSGVVYFIAFFPANMSPDSLSSWDQAHTFKFNNWHPIMFTWLIMVLTFIWDSPAIVSLFQNLVLSLIFAYSFWQLQKLGARKILLVGMCLVIAVIPTYGVFTTIIWKDVLFSGSLALFTVHLFLIMYSKGKWLESKVNIFFFFISSFGVAFLRHNGFPVFVLTMIAVLVIYRKKILKVGVPIFLILVILHQLLVGPIFKYLNVKPSDPNEALSIPTQQIANIIKNDGVLTTEQRNYFNSIFPIEMWKEKYQPHTVDPIKFSWGDYRRDVIYNDFPKYFKTWAQVVIQNPSLATEAFLHQTALVWDIKPEVGFTSTYFLGIIDNKYGLENKTSALTTPVTNYLEASRKSPYVNFLWRPAFYAFIILFSFVLLWLKHGRKSSIVFLPFLLNALSVAAALPAQDFRYLLGNVFISFVFPIMALIKPNEIEE
jgi:hypothetical protein